MMRIVIAPDKFKGSLGATEVAAAIAAGLRAGLAGAEPPGAELVTIPVADGGEGTVDAAVAAGFERVLVTAAGPLGEPVRASYARRGEVAVIELLQALGARVLDARGEPLGRGLGVGAALGEVAALDLTGLHPALRSRSLTIATDVDNPLTGPSGAAEVYGPQKGATPAQVRELAGGLRHWAAVVASATGTETAATDWSQAPGSGAAGGVGFAARAVLGAEPRPGIGLVLDLVGFDAALAGAALVITGEGSLDTQSLSGKAPVGVARAAARRGIPVVAAAGRSTLTAAQLAAAGMTAVYPLIDLEPDPARCSAEASVLLKRVGRAIARDRLAGLLRTDTTDAPADRRLRANSTGEPAGRRLSRACGAEGYPSPAELAAAQWTTLVPRSAVTGDTRNEFEITAADRFTHVRLTIFPDGGVARLRVYGEPVPDPRLLPGTFDLAALENGAIVTDCSNMFYSSPANLLMPGLAQVMGDGWETSRRRDQDNDWVVVRLACAGSVEVVELDTSHFGGNSPGWAALSYDGGDLLTRTALQPDTRHRFAVPGGPVAEQVRLDVYPDGGMARLRVFGQPTPAARTALADRFLGLLPEPHLAGLLRAAGRPADEATRRAGSRGGLEDLPPSAREQFSLGLYLST